MTDQREPVRTDLCRSVPFTTARSESDEPNDGRTLSGYAAVFNTPTRIDSWEGTFDEVIAPGAFRKSLKERTPRMQFDHGMHPLIGSIPIGRFTVLEEDSTGLRVEGRLTDNWLIQPVRDAIAEESIDGMSFRFSVIREEWTDNKGKKLSEAELFELLWDGGGERGPLQRTLKEVRMSEAGPVVWPAYEATSVGVRSQKVTIDLGRLSDPQERQKLAHAAFLLDAAVRNTETVDAPPPDGTPTEQPHIDAPQPTEVQPEVTPDPEPTPTETDAGEHSFHAEARARRERMLRSLRQAHQHIAEIEKKGYRP